MLVAGAALSPLETEFEVRVTGHDGPGVRPERGIDWRASEVRVDDHPAAVDDPPEGRRSRGGQSGAGGGDGFGFDVWASLRADVAEVDRDGILEPVATEFVRQR